MNRSQQNSTLLAFVFIMSSAPLAMAVTLVDYNFNGGADGQLVSGNTGGAVAGVLNSGVNAPYAHPNTLINAVTGTDLSAAFPQSIIKHWSDRTTETTGGNFVGMTYDTTLPPGAENRAGYDGQAVQFVRSGILHSQSNVPGSVNAFTAFARIYWEDNALYDYETLFSNGSRLNQNSWWVGIDFLSKQLTWSFTNGSVNSTFEHPHLAGVSTPVLTPNTWIDVAVTFQGDASIGNADNDTLKVYIDGTLFDTYTAPAVFRAFHNALGDDWSFWTPGGTGTLQVGGTYAGQAPFHSEEFRGLMERFMFFDTALSDAQVAALTTAPALTGDYNDDGDVDARDYVIWRKTNINSGAGYTAFYQEFGNYPPPGSGGGNGGNGAGDGAVPEPGTLLLAIASASALLFSRRRVAELFAEAIELQN